MPHDDSSDAQLQEIAGSFIRAKVRRVVGRAGLREQDRADLEQETWLRLWPRLRTYAPAKGRPHGFLRITIDRILLNELRDRYAAKRDFRRVGSLHVKVQTDEGEAELGQTLSQQGEDTHQGRSARSDAEWVDLRRDLAETLARLTEEQRQLAEELQHDTLAEIARRRGVPRSTLQAHVRQLRAVFDRAGLRDYLR